MISLLDCPKCGTLRVIGRTGLICPHCNGRITPIGPSDRACLLRIDPRAAGQDITSPPPLKRRRLRDQPPSLFAGLPQPPPPYQDDA